jgi:histone demethylase
MGQNAKFASKMGLGKMGFVGGHQPAKPDPEVDSKADLRGYIPNSVQMTSAELLAASKALDLGGGDVSTSIYREPRPKGGLGCPLPPERPAVPLTKEELLPPTPTVYIQTKEEAFSPHLLDLCLKHPIVLVRNLAPACNLDLQLYTTKTLVDMHPNHPVILQSNVDSVSCRTPGASVMITIFAHFLQENRCFSSPMS